MSSPILTDSHDAAAGDPVGALFVALRAVIASAWPEVVSAGIYEADHADQVPWASLGVPRAVVTIGAMTATTEWGSTLDNYIATVEITYLCQIAGPLSQIRAKLMGIRRAINLSAIDTPQGANCLLDWSDMLRVNAVLKAEESDIRAGMYRFTALCGEPYLLA